MDSIPIFHFPCQCARPLLPIRRLEIHLDRYIIWERLIIKWASLPGSQKDKMVHGPP